MSHLDLKREMQEYGVQASSLELKRKEIVSRLQIMAMNEIVPKVAALLPQRFSLDRDRTEVYSDNKDPRSVPSRFGVNLRLLYEDEPIFGAPLIVGIIQSDPRLEDLAREYGLAEILPVTEPIEIG